MVNHGFSTGALFLVVGFLASRRGSRMVDDFGGVAKVAPWLGAMVLIAGLSALSLPGLSTFVSEFLVLVGTFTVHRWFAVVGIAGIVLAAVYVLWMVQRTIHGPVASAVEHFRDLSFREAWVIGPVMLAIVFLGVNPKPLLDRINPSVQRVNVDVRNGDPLPTALLKCERPPTGSTAYQSTLILLLRATSCPPGFVAVPTGGHSVVFTSNASLTSNGSSVK
jgi:NADH-quinone oxidoreductase subunit M